MSSLNSWCCSSFSQGIRTGLWISCMGIRTGLWISSRCTRSLGSTQKCDLSFSSRCTRSLGSTQKCDLSLSSRCRSSSARGSSLPDLEAEKVNSEDSVESVATWEIGGRAIDLSDDAPARTFWRIIRTANAKINNDKNTKTKAKANILCRVQSGCRNGK